ncbi:MAG: hypothetical protein M1839_005137 [Geoglossum umbratile]|nr:MAG: hypothetical protein M1839_005137 [Geoglossum umbratile]
MEGFLLVPPERNIIIGRAIWKPRFVCLGPDRSNQLPPNRPLMPRRISAGAFTSPRRHLKFASQNVSTTGLDLQPADATIYLSIFKQQGDTECIVRYPLDSIKSVCIEDMAHRRQGPALPTLVVTLDQELPSNKRRSSQSGNVLPIRSRANSLLFRTAKDDARDIHDWYQAIQNQLNPKLEPSNRLFDPGWGFNNSSRTLKLNTRGPYSPPGYPVSNQANATLLSPSSSVRSMRSDLSSSESDKKSFYSRGTPELPSPVFEMPLTPVAEGHAVVQIGSGSPSPMYEEESTGLLTPSSPRRETILDRAFMMNCVPGGVELATSPEQNSIERFEALMRNLEARQAQKTRRPDAWSKGSGSNSTMAPASPTLPSAFEPPERVPTPTKRVLEFISSGSITPPQSPGYEDDGSDYDSGDDAEDDNEDNDTPSRRPSGVSFYEDDESGAPQSTGGAALMNPNSTSRKRLTFTDFASRRISTGSASFMFLTHSHSRQGSLSSTKHDPVDETVAVGPVLLTARPFSGRMADGSLSPAREEFSF